MPVPTAITDLSTTAASNSPAGSDSPSSLDDVQRAHGAFIAQIRDAVGMATGALAPATARTSFGAAASGANTDITSLGAVASINGGQLAGLRNRIVNGNFDVWQRDTAFASGSPQYGPDRWQVYRSGEVAGALFTRTYYGGNFEAGSTYAIRMQRNSGYTSTADIVCATSLETVDVFKLRGKKVTLSFWSFRGADYSGGSTGFGSVFQGTGTDGSLGVGFTSATTLGTVLTTTAVLTKYSVTVTVGALASQLGVSIGYTPSGTAGAADFMEITGVQLEIGSVATPFEQRPYSMELALCQRYYETGNIVVTNNAGHQYINNYFKVTKRASPTIAVSVGGQSWVANTVVFYTATTGALVSSAIYTASAEL